MMIPKSMKMMWMKSVWFRGRSVEVTEDVLEDGESMMMLKVEIISN